MSAEEAVAHGELSAQYDARLDMVSSSGGTSIWRITNIAADDDYRLVVEPAELARVDPEAVSIDRDGTAEITIVRSGDGPGQVVLRSAHRDDDLAEEPLP